MSMSIFVAGDFHIPSRATMMLPEFENILKSKKWDYIVLTGDYTLPAVIEHFIPFVKTARHLFACRGNMDRFFLEEQLTFSVYDLTFGVYHGTAIHPRGDIAQLKSLAQKLKAKILFTGHTHQQLVHFKNDCLLLNPGTATGASGGSSWTVDTGILTLEVSKDKTIAVKQIFLSDGYKLQTVEQSFQL